MPRDDDDVPCRSFGGRLSFAVDDSHPQVGGGEYRFRDRTYGERLARSGAGYDSKSLSPSGEVTNLLAMLLFEHGLDVECKRELDCLACGAGGGDHDDAPGERLRGNECCVIGRQELVAYVSHQTGSCKKRGEWDTGALTGTGKNAPGGE